MDDLHKQLEALHAERGELDRKISDIKMQLQDICDHDWKWHQIVGEGRYCNKCMKRDFSDD
jgi:hypothetical protein